MLACIMTRPDECRLAHTATSPTSGSVFVAKHNKSLDIGFGKVSFARDVAKDTGDICRLAIWAKRVLDQLGQQYSGMEEACVPFFQIVSTKCIIYQMRRVGTICVAVQVGEMEIVQDLPELLLFEPHVFTWLALDFTFTRLLQNTNTVTKNKRTSLPGLYYHGLCNPSTRKMAKV
ncbi:hypothetical protein BC939DRAFT_260199 [Gamsiella multidivaricata]|uniref:uncharacterized protein n=1 Tax=Gamsiella multidivaricata TaxID=101098 RepID=UPI00221F59FF|nr:uncharacterized protein BC939DRAFT_260199 [Gamsiella multidivaricata]KAI7830748.1 hypothetical protein BC939DRAFT_260199 [Gamsiella multidivaricata]